MYADVFTIIGGVGFVLSLLFGGAGILGWFERRKRLTAAPSRRTVMVWNNGSRSPTPRKYEDRTVA